MKKAMLVGLAMVMALTLGLPSLYAQQQSAPPQAPDWYCPWMGSGQGGMMGQGMMMNCPMMGQGGMMQQGMAPGQQRGKPVTEDQAKTLVENYVKSTNNPNLKMGKLTDEKDKDYFVAEIVTKDGSLADKIQVNKNTGWFRSAYGK